MSAYHNTVPINGVDYEQRNKKTSTENERILLFFMQRANVPFSACDVHRELHILLTNVRRSITNLTQAHKLKKTNERKQGMYGHPVSMWVYESPRPEPVQMELMP